MNKELERRYNHMPVRAEVRTEGDDSKEYIEGIAAKVGERTMIGSKSYGFYEEIAPGAFDDILDNDVRCLFNHDPNMILSRTKSGTLRIFKNEEGHLAYSSDVPNRQWARDVKDAIETGDIDGSSFAFRVAEGGDRWEFREDNPALDMDLRIITKYSEFLDVSPVTYPAYSGASSGIAKRSLDAWEEARSNKKEEEKEVDAFHDDAQFRYKYNLNNSKK